MVPRPPRRRPSPARIGLAAALLLGSAALWRDARPVAAAIDVFVNTTEDLPYDASLCLPGKACSLRAALGRIEGKAGTVRACYDPAEVGGAKRCPPGWQPLRQSDPGYDAAQGKWVFRIGDEKPPYEIGSNDNTLDFTRDIDGWDGPEDNRVVIDSGNNLELKQAISLVQSKNNKLMGFEITGSYVLAGIDVLDRATDNQFGPGLIFSGITSGAGLRFYGPETVRNRLVGSWCGLTGDGTALSPVADDCVQILDRSGQNVVGGPAAADRNVLGGSRLGVGVSILEGSTGNRVEGNWIGLDARGEAADSNLGGVRISQESHGAQIVGNVIGGNRGPGISIADATRDVLIQANRIGTMPDGEGEAANREYGVRIIGAPKATLIEANRILFNASGGIFISGSGTYDNTMTGNSITRNDGPAIQVVQGANKNVRPPQISFVSTTLVQGTACAGCTVEVFSDPGSQAEVWEASVQAGADGLFRLEKAEGFRYRELTATATNGRNTSALSAAVAVPGGTSTPPPVRTPTVTPTRDPGALVSIFLPWLGRQAAAR